MTVSSVTAATGTSVAAAKPKSGFAALGANDFLRLMTEQMKMQDPFTPTDNKEMLAQMAQFSSLAGQTDVADTLKSIAAKLDKVLEQKA